MERQGVATVFFALVALVTLSLACARAPRPLPADPAPSGKLADGVRVVQVTAQRYHFDPNPIVVRQGEKVRLEVTSQDVTHGFGLSDFGIDRELPPHKTQTIEFAADKPGRHMIHCTHFCGIGHLGMRADLVVLPPAPK